MTEPKKEPLPAFHYPARRSSRGKRQGAPQPPPATTMPAEAEKPASASKRVADGILSNEDKIDARLAEH
jgi:hypothetical protein